MLHERVVGIHVFPFPNWFIILRKSHVFISSLQYVQRVLSKCCRTVNVNPEFFIILFYVMGNGK